MRIHRAVVVVSLLLGPLPAWAEDWSALPSVPLSLVGCPDDWTSRLGAQLRIEIDSLGREHPTSEHSDIERVSVECRGGAVRIRVRVVSGAENETKLDRARVEPDALVRTVALSAAELVGALWFDAAARPPPEARRTKLEVRPTPGREPVSRPPPLFWLGGSVRRAGSPATWLLGGTLASELPLTRVLVPFFDLRAELGRAKTVRAPVSVEAWSLGAHLLLDVPARSVRVGVGPGLRVGWAVLRGEPAAGSELDGHQVGGIFAGPALLGRVGYALSVPFPWVGLTVDGGLITRSVTGRLDAGPALFEFGGAWAGLTLCLGFSG